MPRLPRSPYVLGMQDSPRVRLVEDSVLNNSTVQLNEDKEETRGGSLGRAEESRSDRICDQNLKAGIIE